MKKNILCLFLLLFVSFVSVSVGQNSVEIREKYGQSTEVFSISEHIWMEPQYATDGQVCQMRLFPKLISPVNYLSDVLNVYELRQILTNLAPGKESKLAFNGTTFSAGTFARTVRYENMVIRFIGAIRGKIKLTKGDKKQALRDEAKDQFPIPTNTKIVIIKWNSRNCADESN